MKINQIACARLSLISDDSVQELVLDGVHQQTKSSAQEWEQITWSAKWDAEKTSVSGEHTFAQRLYPAVSVSSIGGFKLSLTTDDRLVVEMEGSGDVYAPESAGGHSKFSFKTNCEYTKLN
jgi:hypothetical protein